MHSPSFDNSGPKAMAADSKKESAAFFLYMGVSKGKRRAGAVTYSAWSLSAGFSGICLPTRPPLETSLMI